jgi:uridine kinase
MSLLRLKKEGWFDKPEILDVSLTEDQLERLKDGQVITVTQLGSFYTIEIRKNIDRKRVTAKDIIINKLQADSR